MNCISAEQKALFCLLRAGLWDKAPADLSAFPLTATGWNNVHRMAVRQTVAGIVCRGICLLPDSLLPPESIMVRWVAEADRIERRNIGINAAAARLADMLAAGSLRPVALKGQAVAALYPQPLLRQCGDIDLYFATKQEERRAENIMQKAGCRIERLPDGSCCYLWQGFEVEHHTRLFDIYNPFVKSYLSALTRKHGYSVRRGLTVPAPLPELLMLSAHLLKHLMGHGAGLRQFCDIARAYHTLRGSYSTEELESAYRTTGLYRWSLLLHTFLAEHLGLPHSDLPYTGSGTLPTTQLMDIVMQGGNFGQYGTTKGHPAHAAWQRKLHTVLAYWQRRGFSASTAPGEAFFASARLIFGNLLPRVRFTAVTRSPRRGEAHVRPV